MLSVHSLTIVLNSGHKGMCFGVEICANRSRFGSLNADTCARLKYPLEILASSISSTCFRISASGGSIAATWNSVSFSLLLRLLLSSAQTPLDRELLPIVHSIAGKLTCETWRRDQKIDKTVIDVKTVSANTRTRNDITQLKVGGGEGGSSSLALPPNPMCKNAVAAALLLIPYKRLSATIAPGFLVRSSTGTCCYSLSQSLCSSFLLLGKSTRGRTRIAPICVCFSPTEFLFCRQHLRLTKFFPSLRPSSLPSTKRFVCPSNSYICFQSSVAAACPSHSRMIPSSKTTSLCDLP